MNGYIVIFPYNFFFNPLYTMLHFQLLIKQSHREQSYAQEDSIKASRCKLGRRKVTADPNAIQQKTVGKPLCFMPGCKVT